MVDPGDPERGTRDEDDKGLSSLAEGYQKAAPIMAASSGLVAAVGVFTGLGWWLDRKLGNDTPWLTLLGALIGMTGGFISFFKVALARKRK